MRLERGWKNAEKFVFAKIFATDFIFNIPKFKFSYFQIKNQSKTYVLSLFVSCAPSQPAASLWPTFRTTGISRMFKDVSRKTSNPAKNCHDVRKKRRN